LLAGRYFQNQFAQLNRFVGSDRVSIDDPPTRGFWDDRYGDNLITVALNDDVLLVGKNREIQDRSHVTVDGVPFLNYAIELRADRTVVDRIPFGVDEPGTQKQVGGVASRERNTSEDLKAQQGLS
jgi:hypothetical protein